MEGDVYLSHQGVWSRSINSVVNSVILSNTLNMEKKVTIFLLTLSSGSDMKH